MADDAGRPDYEPVRSGVRLTLGADVACSDGAAGRLDDVVVDPGPRRVTHLVVAARDERLVPIALLATAAAGAPLQLACTTAQLAELDDPRTFAYLPIGEVAHGDEGHDVGVETPVAQPLDDGATYGMYAGELGTTVALTYDLVPKGEVELRRASVVETTDGSRLGTVDSVVVDDGAITHVAVRSGHLWWRRVVDVAVADIATLTTDSVVVTPSA